MGLPAEEERGGACLPWRQIACSWRGEGNERGRDQVPRRHARTEDCGRVLIGRDLSAASWHCGIVLIADSANPRHTGSSDSPTAATRARGELLSYRHL